MKKTTRKKPNEEEMHEQMVKATKKAVKESMMIATMKAVKESNEEIHQHRAEIGETYIGWWGNVWQCIGHVSE
jgi:hypothetical protein